MLFSCLVCSRSAHERSDSLVFLGLAPTCNTHNFAPSYFDEMKAALQRRVLAAPARGFAALAGSRPMVRNGVAWMHGSWLSFPSHTL